MRRLQADVPYIDAVLRDGSNRARERAAKTMSAVRDIVGFVR
jgi:tryptophanyl-tRNA synthetase